MVEYQRPEFYVEEFVANEYVAACNKVQGEEIKLSCKCGTKIETTVKATNETGSRINLNDGSVIYLDAVSGSDQIIVYRTGSNPNGCYVSAYGSEASGIYPGAGSNGDMCKVYNETHVLESTYHHHATVTSVSNFS